MRRAVIAERVAVEVARGRGVADAAAVVRARRVGARAVRAALGARGVRGVAGAAKEGPSRGPDKEPRQDALQNIGDAGRGPVFVKREKIDARVAEGREAEPRRELLEREYHPEPAPVDTGKDDGRLLALVDGIPRGTMHVSSQGERRAGGIDSSKFCATGERRFAGAAVPARSWRSTRRAPLRDRPFLVLARRGQARQTPAQQTGGEAAYVHCDDPDRPPSHHRHPYVRNSTATGMPGLKLIDGVSLSPLDRRHTGVSDPTGIRGVQSIVP
ncbi:hypothetical protein CAUPRSCDRAFT_10774 [Caulochytrium protostelioides]|uniref:Uncharacterized protein n=1 Tax=Caulochytrium protostelioides TaxID=1555241 RepID=A0A4P9WZ21_9FUNG|nr:hypothetical protein CAUPRSCDRAFT_10774 [Caulochytrium protostelioides]